MAQGQQRPLRANFRAEYANLRATQRPLWRDFGVIHDVVADLLDVGAVESPPPVGPGNPGGGGAR